MCPDHIVHPHSKLRFNEPYLQRLIDGGITAFNQAGAAMGTMVAQLKAAVQFPARPGVPSEFAALARHVIENPMLNGTVLRLDGAYRVPPGDPSWWAT